LDFLHAQAVSPTELRSCRLFAFAIRISLRSIRTEIRSLHTQYKESEFSAESEGLLQKE